MRLLLMLFLTSSFHLSPANLRKLEVPNGDKPHLTLLTYNVLFSSLSDATVNAIVKADADIVCLQETNATWQKKLKADLKGVYPNAIGVVGDKYANGEMVFSKVPLRDIQRFKPTAGGWFTNDSFIAETALGPVQILNVHLRPLVADHGGGRGRLLHCRPNSRKGIDGTVSEAEATDAHNCRWRF